MRTAKLHEQELNERVFDRIISFQDARGHNVTGYCDSASVSYSEDIHDEYYTVVLKVNDQRHELTLELLNSTLQVL